MFRSNYSIYLVAMMSFACGATSQNERSVSDGESPASSQTLEMEKAAGAAPSTGHDLTKKGVANPTCKKAGQSYILLDIDADGVVDPYRDGPLLISLFEGKPDDVFFRNPKGNRANPHLYFTKILRPQLDIVNHGRGLDRKDIDLVANWILLDKSFGTAQQKTALLNKFGANNPGARAMLDILMWGKNDCGESPEFRQAYNLDNQYGLEKRGAGFLENSGGPGYKWLWSRKEAKWFFMKSDLQVYRWDYNKSSWPRTGKKVGKVDQYYYENPDRFVSLVK